MIGRMKYIWLELSCWGGGWAEAVMMMIVFVWLAAACAQPPLWQSCESFSWLAINLQTCLSGGYNKLLLPNQASQHSPLSSIAVITTIILVILLIIFNLFHWKKSSTFPLSSSHCPKTFSIISFHQEIFPRICWFSFS